MKVLVTGHYREGSGWAKATQGLILAMDSVGIDVVCRNIPLTKNADAPNRIEELEKKELVDIDHCIQYVLPHHLVGTTKFKKNIAHVVFESSCLTFNSWLDQLKYMDEVWVPCQQNKNDLQEAGINKVCVIPNAFDISTYSQVKNHIDLKNYGASSSYKFYTIADLSQRKNLQAIIRTYYATFNSCDDVCLIIKVNKHGYSKQELFSVVHELSSSIRKKMRIYENDIDYPSIILIADDFSDEEISALHNGSDCFVNLSHGEAWSIPSFEAMCYGNHPICVNWGGPKEYIDKNNTNTGSLVNYVMQPCMMQDGAFDHLFKGNEFWTVPDEQEASKAMRHYFETRNNNPTSDGIKQGERFSFQAVGNMIKETLGS